MAKLQGQKDCPALAEVYTRGSTSSVGILSQGFVNELMLHAQTSLYCNCRTSACIEIYYHYSIMLYSALVYDKYTQRFLQHTKISEVNLSAFILNHPHALYAAICIVGLVKITI